MSKREAGIKAKSTRERGEDSKPCVCVGHDRGHWEKACGKLRFTCSSGARCRFGSKGRRKGDAWGPRCAHSDVCTYPSLYAAAAAAAAVAAVAVAGCAYL